MPRLESEYKSCLLAAKMKRDGIGFEAFPSASRGLTSWCRCVTALYEACNCFLVVGVEADRRSLTDRQTYLAISLVARGYGVRQTDGETHADV
jgi:hypothetical protein